MTINFLLYKPVLVNVMVPLMCCYDVILDISIACKMAYEAAGTDNILLVSDSYKVSIVTRSKLLKQDYSENFL